MLAYGVAVDAVDDYMRIAESDVRICFFIIRICQNLRVRTPDPLSPVPHAFREWEILYDSRLQQSLLRPFGVQDLDFCSEA
ncbi:hypothetical protein MRB53_014096 [Persea americana]|uniref:Uncharacterized protein n=1 Tax=Persea americana TaxID=3435 RepID=A0ACC2K9X1_PERAE|nr:hypothetical protein MRB53_014096 [Persea americana]